MDNAARMLEAESKLNPSFSLIYPGHFFVENQIPVEEPCLLGVKTLVIEHQFRLFLDHSLNGLRYQVNRNQGDQRSYYFQTCLAIMLYGQIFDDRTDRYKKQREQNIYSKWSFE